MKIRWSRSSVRLRISPTELDALQHGETVTEQLSVPGGNWTVALSTGADATALTMNGATLQLCLSADDYRELALPENEGVYFGGKDKASLRYYIEKDFPCAHPRAAEASEPQSDTFTPPAQFTGRKKNED